MCNSPGCPGTCLVDQAGLELTCLCFPSAGWESRSLSPPPIYTCVSVLPACILCTTKCMPSAPRDQKRVSHPLGWELQTILSSHPSVGKLNPVLWKSNQYSETLSHLSNLQKHSKNSQGIQITILVNILVNDETLRKNRL